MTTIGRCWMAAFGLMVATAACGSSDAPEGTKGGRIERPPTPENEFTPRELEATVDNLIAKVNEGTVEPMQMVVLLKNLNPFFTSIATGASRAMSELEVSGNVLGPVDQSTGGTTSQEIQNQQIAQAVTDGIDGIGVSPYGDVNAAAIDDAVEQGVHVVTLDGDVPTSKRSLYVGTNNESAGAAAAQTLLAMLPPPPGTVLIHGTAGTDWVDGFNRTEGAREAIEKAGYEPLVSEAFYELEEGFDVEWIRSRIAAADPPVLGIVGVFDISYRCAMGADAARRPEIPIVAFDFDPRTVEFMRQGRIKATVIQRQYYQGYLVPYILYGIKTLGLDGTKEILAPLMEGDSTVDTGTDTVPADKIDAYNDFLDTIGAVQ
ncbi:substrate-binding domain-containing protein [Sorangium sp. So ce513]|uniref:substrate-binding domain-containing protein n=1 Tax=Sorangium sp. So ce513 TaxID=3133315 RepID=UPI003F6443BC